MEQLKEPALFKLYDRTIWTEGAQTFSGVRFKDLLEIH